MGLFGASELEGAIGKNGIEQLKGIAVDKGTAFLSNQVTSAFVQTANNSAVKSLTQGAVVGVGAYAVASETIKGAPEIIQELAQKIILKATEIVTAEATKCVMNYTKKHLSEISGLPGAIMAQASQTFNDEKMSVGDIVKELMGNSDEEAEKYLEEQEKNQQSNFITKSKEKINDISNNVTKYTKEITDKISQVTNYMEEGPDWVVDQLDKQCQSAADYVNKLVDEQWKKDKAAYNQFVKAQGEAIGSKMASTFNAQLRKAQKSLLDKQQSKVQAALTKAKTKILGSALSLAAKTGIL